MLELTTKDKQKEYKRNYYQKNKESINIKHKKYYIENKERISVNGKKYREKNKEKIDARQKLHIEKIKVRSKLYREKNKEQVQVKKREYYEKNKARINEKRKQKYANNEDGIRDKRHKYVKDNPVMFRTYRSLRRAKEKNQLHPDHDKNVEKVLRESANRIQNCLNVKFCVDHILPVRHGGMHHHLNMQIMPSDINLKKLASLTWEHEYYRNWKQLPDFLIPSNLKPIISERSSHTIGLDLS